jgi:hypothetical protein
MSARIGWKRKRNSSKGMATIGAGSAQDQQLGAREMIDKISAKIFGSSSREDRRLWLKTGGSVVDCCPGVAARAREVFSERSPHAESGATLM